MKRGHILIADDDPGLSYMAELVLRREGYTVGTASNGHEALMQIERHMPNLLLLDLQMPVMDGWDVGRRLRDTGKGDLPIVLLTSQDQVRDSYEDVQAAHVLAKPFDMDELLSVVAHYCQPINPREEKLVDAKTESASLTLFVLLITLAFLVLRLQPFRPKPGNAVVEVWHSVLFFYRAAALFFRGAFFVVNACNALMSTRSG